MTKELMFSYHGKSVRTEERNGEIWWVAKDVCEILGIANNRDALTRLDEEEKGVASIYTLGGKQELSIVNESGLYSLILRSDKEEAKKFKKWVTSEVLPQIRKTGSYNQKPMTQMELAKFTVDKMLEQEKKLLEYDHKFDQLPETIEKQVKETLKNEAINVFPDGCLTLKKIREKYFKGISESQISNWLNFINHPSEFYTHLIAPKITKVVSVYRDKGLNAAFIRLIDESIKQKETDQNTQYYHKALGNFRIKKDC